MYLIYRLIPFKSIENPKRNDGFSPEHEKIEKKRGRQPLEAVDLLTVLYREMLQEESGERKDVLPAFRE